ncbi:hypothetical protein H4Q26_002912 [Puccinia striiformis f. sp. tritici PST-130]|nr:hypothetical protein H4Q26_002912 [Puccinia striiformis f. sp. tritici PST-130]
MISHSTGTFNFGSTSTPPQRAQEKSNEVVVKFSDEIVQRMLEQHQAERHSSQQWTASAVQRRKLSLSISLGCETMSLYADNDRAIDQKTMANPPIKHETQIWEDLIDQMVMSAIHNGAFPIMVSDLLAFKKKGPRTDDALRVATADDLPGIEKNFQIGSREDVHVSMRYHSSNPDMSESPPAPPHHDIEALFKVIAAPIATLLILHNIDDPTVTLGRSTKLTGIVRWASECRQLGMVQSFYEMLASSATGPRCSDLAYSFLMSGSSEDGTNVMNSTMSRIADAMGRINLLTCSWSSIFGQSQYYIQALQALSLQKNSAPENKQLIPPEPHYTIIKGIDPSKLFRLAACPMALDLKAELLLAIAAFAAPGNKIGADIARKCWLTLEHSQIISTNSWDLPAEFGAAGALSLTSGELIRTGILAELEPIKSIPDRQLLFVC